MKCLNCNSEEFEEDYIKGEAVCVICGVICEIVCTENANEYIENEFGDVQAVGKLQFSGSTSKYKSQVKAKETINALCIKLRLSDLVAENALEFYKNLLEKGKTNCVSRNMIAGICIYMAAQLKYEPIVLLDISDKINVSVYRLGRLYNKLKTALGLEIKSPDPSVFVERVAEIFVFPYQKKEIIQSTRKILKVMENEMIEFQGNPKIVAIAALIISAQLHKVDIVCDNLEKKIGVHMNSINTFIKKWKNSPTSDLTLAEFNSFKSQPGTSREIIDLQINEIVRSEKHRNEDLGEDLDLSDSSDKDELLEQQYLNTKSAQETRTNQNTKEEFTWEKRNICKGNSDKTTNG